LYDTKENETFGNYILLSLHLEKNPTLRQ